MSALDDKIDDLYKQPLADFTAARNALAKSLSKDEAARVKALAKPNVVPWAVNQVYWRARGVYDRLLKAGDRLRKAQIAALEGKAAEVRAAGDAHRHAIAEAVKEAERLAGAAGSKPSPDALARSFEALSLAAEPPEPHGRITEALQPSGFEALTGVTIGAAPRPTGPAKATWGPAKATSGPAKAGHYRDHGGGSLRLQTDRDRGAGSVRLQPDRDRKREREEAEAARKEEEARRAHDAEMKTADAAVARAEAQEKLARDTWERAHDALLEARRTRDDVRRAKLERP